MRRILHADSDTYITDKVIGSLRCTDANVGNAGSLDLFKLYGETMSGSHPNLELSRLLVHFDLAPIRTLLSSKKIDTSTRGFACTLHLFDVYGGQPTPANFDVVVHPLSGTFVEGVGQDVVFYGDVDACNFLSSSMTSLWYTSGANAGGAATANCDYIVSANMGTGSGPIAASQHFANGDEDLSVDVTAIVSATLAGILPDSGFRVALASAHESDAFTYYVKRFGSRTAHDPTKHPELIMTYDDSLQDDTAAMSFDADCVMFLRNRSRTVLSDLVSGSSHVTGSSCLLLKMATEISGGWHEVTFTGSQHMNGRWPVTGVYSASVNLNSQDSVFKQKLAASGSVIFRPIWGSLDGTVSYYTGSNVTVAAPERSDSNSVIEQSELIVTATSIGAKLIVTEHPIVRINIHDPFATDGFVVKAPLTPPSLVIRDVHASVRDVHTGDVPLPFDLVGNSSRASSDAAGHYFELQVQCLEVGHTYTIDVMFSNADTSRTFRSVSNTFTVVAAQ